MDPHQDLGAAGLVDRPSCAHAHPRRTPADLEAAILALRQARKLGPARIAPLVGLPASTVYRVLCRQGLNRLAVLDRPTGQPIRRYERGPTCAGFLRRAGAFFATHGIAVQRVLTDNAFAYRHSAQVRAAVAELGAVQRFTRPYRPQTNGKVDRFNRTLLAEWAYLRPYATNQERTAALDGWLHLYNHHRSHTALGGHPPISRLNNAAKSYS